MIYEPVEQKHFVEFVEQDNGKKKRLMDGKYYFPSVSKILGATSDKTAIEEWRKRVGDKEADRICRMSTNRGNAFHKLIENKLKKNEDPTAPLPHVKKMYDGVQKVLTDRTTRIIANELPLYSKVLGVQGIVDLVADFDGKLSVIDLKGSKKPKKDEWIEEYYIQCAIYAMMWNELYSSYYGSIDQIVTLIAIDPSQCSYAGKPQVFTKSSKKYIPTVIDRVREYYTLQG